MRIYAFVFSILGIGVLMLFLSLNGKEVSVIDDLEELEINQKVIVTGVVEGVRDYGAFKIMIINGIEIVCECEGFQGKQVEIEGLVSEFNGKKQIKLLEISLK